MIPEDVLSSMEMIRESARGISGPDLSRIRKLRRGVHYGLGTMCIGGGQGMAAIYERA